MTTRVVGACVIASASCGLGGVLSDVSFTGGGSCPATIPHVTFHWSKAVAELSGSEQTQVSAARSLLQAKLDSEEPCGDLRDAVFFNLVLSAGGIVQVVQVWVTGPVAAGQARQMWGPWTKDRVAFTSGERSQLDALVGMLSAHLSSEEPLS